MGRGRNSFDLGRCNDWQMLSMEGRRKGKREESDRYVLGGVDMWATTLRLDVTLHEKMVSPNQS